jgi:hypothetical protein
MAEPAPLPKHVEDFIATTGRFLSQFKLNLEFKDELKPEGRRYVVEAQDGPVEIIVHRTQRSLDRPVGEYRVRVWANTDSEFCRIAADKEDMLNRTATFGALLAAENAVVSQALIPTVAADTTAGLLAVAIAHARRSLVASNAKVFSGREGEPVEQMSAWTDLDFEGLHYDYAHLGIGDLGRWGWRMEFLAAGTLTINAVHNNPYWGGGLLCLLRVPKKGINGADRVSSRQLNTWDHLVGDAPTFGAWLTDDDDFVFVRFLPNFVKGLDSLMDMVVSQSMVRARELPMLVSAALEAAALESVGDAAS